MSDVPDLSALLCESRWLRALARELCTDAARADDAVQDVWATALEHPPAPGKTVRGWLATVLRRRVHDARRSDSARAARERSVSRSEALEASDVVVERAATHRDVVQALLELGEPFRTAVLLRYFEDLPPRVIAQRTGVPVATVNSRLTRGLAQLRAALDRRYGRATWLAAVVPLARIPMSPSATTAVTASTSTPIALGALAVNLTLKLALPIVLLAGAGWWLLCLDTREPEREHTAAVESTTASPALDATAALALDEAARTEVAREELAPSAPQPAIAASAPIEQTHERVVRGRVLDEGGRGLSGVAVGLEGHAHGDVDRSVTGGRFELTLRDGGRSVIATEAAWTTVLAGSVNVSPTSESTVVVAPRLRVEGRVVDERGDAVSGAELVVELPPHFGADFGFALDSALRRGWRTRTDERGAFVLGELPALAGASVRVVSAEFPVHVQPLPQADDPALVIVLARAASVRGTIEGRVVDPHGAPVAGARVGTGSSIATSDERGRFAIDLASHMAVASGERQEIHLRALLRGYLPAIHTLSADPTEWPSHVVLRLGGPPPSIAGRVLDDDRQPIVDARVWIADATLFGMLDGSAATVESLLATVAHPFWSFVLTDADGRFEIPGLLERDYRVRAADPRTLTLAESKPVPSGTRDVELVLPASDVHEKITGRVLSRGGVPVAGARVKLGREAFAVQVPGGQHDEWIERPPVTTDDEGRFTFEHVPKEGTYLLALSDEILFSGLALTRDMPPDDVVITATLRMHVQLELEPPVDRVDVLHMLDETGRRLPIFNMRGESSHTDMLATVVGGRSEVVSVGETARTIVLYKGEVEVGRRDLALLPKTVNKVRF